METINGVKFSLDLGETIDSHLYYYGCFERSTHKVLQSLLHDGDLVLDIGANVGAHALFMAKKAGSGGRVYAFEPSEFAFRKLRTNADLNPELPITLLNFGISDRNESSVNRTIASSWPVDKTFERMPGQLLPNARTKEETIDLRVLDDFVADNPEIDRLNLIKLDVDGHESAVIEGAQVTIRRFRPLIVLELADFTLRAFDSSARNLCNKLEGLGYLLFDEETLCPLTSAQLDSLENEQHSSINVLASHESRNLSDLLDTVQGTRH